MILELLKNDGPPVVARRLFAAYTEEADDKQAVIAMSHQQAEELVRWLNRQIYGIEVRAAKDGA